jgi:hypothetical protein
MATFDFQLEAGALIRKRLLFNLRSLALRNGLTFEVLADDGGWISTSYALRVSGSPEMVAAYAERFNEWSKKMREEKAEKTP